MTYRGQHFRQMRLLDHNQRAIRVFAFGFKPQRVFRGLKRDEGPTADAATGTGNTQGTEP